MAEERENEFSIVHLVERGSVRPPRTPLPAQKDTAPFTLLDLMLVVLAAGFSSGMAVRAGYEPPLPAFPGDWLVDMAWRYSLPTGVLIYGFAGVLGVAPIIQGLQYLRFRRRHWTAIEWVWTASGACFVFLPLLHLAGAGWWRVEVGLGQPAVEVGLLHLAGAGWWRVGLGAFYRGTLVFFFGTGPVALLCAFWRVIRRKHVPWSGWFALAVLLLWSGLWWSLLWMIWSYGGLRYLEQVLRAYF